MEEDKEKEVDGEATDAQEDVASGSKRKVRDVPRFILYL